MQRSSLRDSEGITWVTAGLSLGKVGLDLRRPDAPGAMTELLNARFLDDRTVCRRDGHRGRLVQDYSAFTLNKTVLPSWVYGHGTLVQPYTLGDDDDIIPNLNWEDVHHPIHRRGGGTFRHGDTDVVWTGDRLLVAADDGPFWGASTFWDRTGGSVPVAKGVPAYLPVQTDHFPPGAVEGDLVETCLTDELRVVAYTNADNELFAWIVNRATGAVVSHDAISGDAVSVVMLRVINSGNTPAVVFLTDIGLYISHWTGVVWTTQSLVDPDCLTFEVAPIAGGFHIAWIADGAIYAGKVAGWHTDNDEYSFRTALATGYYPPTDDSGLGLSVSPAGSLAVAWECEADGEHDVAGGLVCREYTAAAATASDVKPLSDSTSWEAITVCHRGLKTIYGHHPLLVHAARTANRSVSVFEVSANSPDVTGYVLGSQQDAARYNVKLASKSFRVGDEVFAWLRADNSSTLFMIAGARPLVSGIADREEATTRPLNGNRRGICQVVADPLDDTGTLFTWARTYDVGTYAHPGNTRVGDLNFLPALSSAQYGRSTYLAGSHVRCWDGVELGDAGFHDYPTTAGAQAAGGTLTADATYRARAYLVRYNKAGERFMSAAIASAAVTLSGSNRTISWTIRTVPVTNHEDAVIEVYRTEGDNGTTFYYDGTVTNDLDAATVVYTSSAEFDIDSLPPGDPHDTGVASQNELEEFGPLGCATLIVAGDRMWGIGGQVPPGSAQFSKLYEYGEGVGFDAIAGSQLIDPAGGEVTSISPFDDTVVVVWQRESFYVLAGSGPDNYGNGAFEAPRLSGTDGATTHAGTKVTPVGVLYWGAGGPRLLTAGFQVQPICDPVRSFAEELTPSGVLFDPIRREVVWYTEEGNALLWNYAAGSRWARWSGLPIAGASSAGLVTVEGRLLTQDATLSQDDGRNFTFKLCTGDISPESMLGGATALGRIGLDGKFVGECRPRFRLYYDGSPLWSEELRWTPTENTWLAAGDTFADLAPADVDALNPTDHSGGFGTSTRVRRPTTRFFRIEVSDVGQNGFIPYELSLEIGAKPGLGRTPVTTFDSRI